MKIHELYTSVTQKVIADLEAGVPSWVQPWKVRPVKGIGMMPSNLVTGRPYSGSNVLLLWITGQSLGFPNLQFATYGQIAGIGASVRKGEKATHIIFTKHSIRKDEESGEDKASTVAKAYAVFNVSQLDNVPGRYLEAQQQPDDIQATHQKAVDFVRGTGIRVQHGANKAAYYPARDEIVMPSLGTFVDEAAYWGVLNHELTHATGHKDRLARTFGKRFADNAYAFEELVAELGSAFVCARLNIEPSFRSASYIESWLKVLKEDNRAIFSAASYAGHAADWLWKKAFEEVEEKRLETTE